MPDKSRVISGAHVDFWTEFITPQTADALRDALRNDIAWHRVGKFPRLNAWFADDSKPYKYTRQTVAAQSKIPAALRALRGEVENFLGVEFPYALANLYENGLDHVGYHQDTCDVYGGNPTVASVSFGAERAFYIRPLEHGAQEKFELSHGSLLVMWAPMQRRCAHSVPERTRVTDPRINISFRSPSRAPKR